MHRFSKSVRSTFFLFVSLVSLNLVSAQTQVGSDIDGEAASDLSGHSVSMSSDGATVAIGAYGNNGNGSYAGHVRVYKWNGSSWVQLGIDIDGEAALDGSGWSVSMSSDGTTVAIGAYSNDGNGSDAGHVRVYKWNGSSWVQLGSDIDGEAADDFSGISVSLSSDGTTLAIGAYGNNGNGSNSGHVRVYKWSGSSWVQVGSDIDGEAADDGSGYSVSISSDGTFVAIGAPYNDGNGSESGHVRVYQWNGSSWVQLGIDIDGEAASDLSGWSVSLSSDGTTVAIGAYGNDGNGMEAGHARVYKWNGSSWYQLGSDIDGETTGDFSGYSLSLSSDGTALAVGAPNNVGNGSTPGHVRVYKWSGSSWVQVGSDIDGEAANDASGWSVSLSSDGTTVAIGAFNNGGNGAKSGHVRIFRLTCTTDLQLYYRPSSFGQNNISTNGGSDGSIRTLVRNGTAPYTYTWTGPATATGANPTSLKAGSYFLHVEDSEGCEGTAGPWNLLEPN